MKFDYSAFVFTLCLLLVGPALTIHLLGGDWMVVLLVGTVCTGLNQINWGDPSNTIVFLVGLAATWAVALSPVFA